MSKLDFDKYKDTEVNSLEDLKLQQLCIASNILKDKEIERLHSIIKEVREYITNNFVSYEDAIRDLRLKVSYPLEIGTDEIGELLEILDKVGDNNVKD